MSPLRSVRHESPHARPQGQQYHRKHNRKRCETADEGEKEALRSVVTELKGWRDNACSRMEHCRNQDGNDKSFHGKCRLTTKAQRPGAREATIATTTLPPGSS